MRYRSLFFNSNIDGQNVEGDNVQPIVSKQLGNIGVSICNESLTDVVMNQQAQLGANFLVLMANDNWFADTQLTFHHFYVTRLRAIETRKDIAINANMEISGVVKATGEINQTLDATNPQVIVSEVTPNNNISYYTLRKTIFISSIFLILIIVFILKRKKHETH